MEVFTSDREIRVFNTHPLHDVIRDGFPAWAFLHERPGGVVVLMAEVTTPHSRYLRFHNPKGQEALSRAFWADLLDTLLGCARARQDVFSRKPERLEVGPGQTLAFELARQGLGCFDPEHYDHATLTVTTGEMALSVPDLGPTDLKLLGNLLINYGHRMETETREYARTDPNSVVAAAEGV